MTPDRKQFIADIANDEWIDRLDPSIEMAKFHLMSEEWEHKRREFLGNAVDPEELHLFADSWNWDGGVNEMNEVIQNPNCEVATAMMVFWRAQPADYSEYQLRADVPEYNLECFDMIKLIVSRYVQGLYHHGKCSYDPKKDFRDVAKIESLACNNWIPREMFLPIHGGN